MSTPQPGPVLIDAGSSGSGWSSIEPFLRCPQLGAYKSELRIPFPQRVPLVRGSLVHTGLAHHYQRMIETREHRDPDRFFEPVEAMRRVATRPEFAPLGPQILPLCERIFAAYLDHYVLDRLEPVAVEQYVETTIPTRYGPRKYTARIDLVVRDRNGRFTIFDHKCSSVADGAKSVWRYTLSGQFLGLQLFGRMLYGEKFAGTRVNVLGAVEPTFRFSRHTPDPAWHAVSCFADNLARAFERREELRASGLSPWRWPKAMSEQVCVTAYGKCDGYELCQYGESALVTLNAHQVLAGATLVTAAP